MSLYQHIVIGLFSLSGLISFVLGYYMCKYKKAAYDFVRPLFFLGIFAWGDALIFGPFWILVTIMAWILNDWVLFLFTMSIYWVVRSVGETIYWFNQQYSSKTVAKWNLPENLPLHSILHDDSIWYVYQIIWQAITVFAIIASLYFGKLWLQGF